MSNPTITSTTADTAPISMADRIAWFGSPDPPELFALLFDQMSGRMTVGDFRAEVRRRAREKGTLS